MKEFKLEENDFVKLCDLLAIIGWCENAGVAKHIVASGVVKVNGEVELRKRAKIISGQIVEYKNQSIKVI